MGWKGGRDGWGGREEGMDGVEGRKGWTVRTGGGRDGREGREEGMDGKDGRRKGLMGRNLEYIFGMLDFIFIIGLVIFFSFFY
jgi:hypothetical protein